MGHSLSTDCADCTKKSAQSVAVRGTVMPCWDKVKKKSETVSICDDRKLMFGAPLFWGMILTILLVGCNRQAMVQRTPDKPMAPGPIVYVALGDSTGSG